MTSKMPSFDTMVEMAKNDPVAFEEMRRELSQEIIDGVSNTALKRRLAGLQFQIDMECRKASNPMASCIRISQMMTDSLMELQESLNGLSYSAPEVVKKNLDPISADILDISSRLEKRTEVGIPTLEPED